MLLPLFQRSHDREKVDALFKQIEGGNGNAAPAGDGRMQRSQRHDLGIAAASGITATGSFDPEPD